MKQLTKKTKGTVSHYGDDSFEFTPYGKGESVYEHSYKVGEAQIGLTKGAGRQNFVAKLKCSTDEADPCEVMHQQLDKLADKEWPDRDKTETKLVYQSGMIVKTKETKIVLSAYKEPHRNRNVIVWQ